MRILRTIFVPLFAVLTFAVNAQWVVTPNGVLADSVTGKDYMIIQRDGSAADLYGDILKNVYRAFTRPDDVISVIENEMISVRGYGYATLKYAGITQYIKPLISVKIEFKDNRMKVSGNWVSSLNGNALSGSPTRTDPYTLFVKGGWKCFDKNGGIKNAKRYEVYNSAVNQFINEILNKPEEDDW